PALALVFIVPFLPGPKSDVGLFEEELDEFEEEFKEEFDGDESQKSTTQRSSGSIRPASPSKALMEAYRPHSHSPLDNFEHQFKLPVDFGLFFFAFANAGVAFSSINTVTWIILASLLLGKTIGITFFAQLGVWTGFPLPQGMRFKHLFVAGVVAGLGLTVALFVAGQAFPAGGIHDAFRGPAKMGAVFSGFVAIVALVLGRLLNVQEESKS
ncbi:MAG: Na+/H+ antiporter NhaA, partial [Myxococcota bacterium]